MKDRNLLVVAFFYPPDNSSSGVLRTSKFTEYLLKHRWRSHVISVPEHLYPILDSATDRAIPHQITVERVWATDVKQAFGIRGVYPRWLATPDRYWPWLFAATRAGARAIARTGIDAIYSTHPVPTAHLVALRLKRRFALPWIADFRDPWVENSMNRFRWMVESKMERAVMSAADRVICNTPSMRRAFLRAYPALPAAKFVTIPNGYDESTLTATIPVRISKFHIIHAGAIDAENRNPIALLRGVRRALDNGWLNESDLQLTFLGAGRYGNAPAFRHAVADNRLEHVVQVVTERISQREAMARTAGADVLVLLSETEAGEGSTQAWTSMQVPVKLYEYLRIGRPLLALVSKGAVTELLESIGASAPIPHRDSDQVAAALKRLYETRTTAPPSMPPANPAVSAYERRYLTSLLAHELDVIVTPRGTTATATKPGTPA